MATLDARTRIEHGEADGQKVDIDKSFIVGGEKMMFPADPNGSGWNTYNCRCTMVADLLDYPDAKPRETYSEWLKRKEPNSVVQKLKILDNPVQSEDNNYNNVLLACKLNNVEYNPVLDHGRNLSENEIIAELSGGDNTQGSCASLGLAYIGQKQGWNVFDFRDGTSRRTFSSVINLNNLSQMNGIKALCYGDVAGKSSTTLAANLLKTCEVGKEYYLCAERHASIVRKIETDFVDAVTGEVTGTKEQLQYLELQSATRSGWTNFNGNPRYTLTQRFGCFSTSGHDERYDFMIDITDSDFSTEEFRSILGFINTEASKQRKGSSGSIK